MTHPEPPRRRWRAIWRAAIILAIGAAFFAAPALRAQDRPGFDDHVTTLINQGRLEDARAAMRTGPASRADRIVFEGRVLKSQGDHAAAIGHFRAALAQDPGHLFARRELAHSLFQTGRYRAARRHLLHLLRTDGSPLLQPGYRALLHRIEAERPFRFGLQFAVEPSTNITRGTYESQLDTVVGSLEIDDVSRAQSGFGLTGAVTGEWRKPLGRTGRATLGWLLSRTVYPSHDRLDRTVARFDLGYGRTGRWRSWRIAPYVTRHWAADGSDMTAPGVSARLALQAGGGRRLHLSVEAEKRRYDTLAARNGPYAVAEAGIGRAIGRGLTLNAAVTLELSRPQAAAQTYDGIGLRIGARKSWPAGVSAALSVFGGIRDFRGVFPLTTTPRDDRFAGLSASVTLENRQIGGFAPRISCAAYRNRSNIGLYRYTARSCSLTLESLF